MRARHVLAAAGIAALAALAACASGTKTADRAAACGLQPGDSTYAAADMVYRDCAVSVKAHPLDNQPRPEYRPSVPVNNACSSVELEFVVSAAGNPESRTAKILRTNDAGYAAAVIGVLGSWRYAPAQRDGVPVRQIVMLKSTMQTLIVVAPAGTRPQMPRRPRPMC